MPGVPGPAGCLLSINVLSCSYDKPVLFTPCFLSVYGATRDRVNIHKDVPIPGWVYQEHHLAPSTCQQTLKTVPTDQKNIYSESVTLPRSSWGVTDIERRKTRQSGRFTTNALHLTLQYPSLGPTCISSSGKLGYYDKYIHNKCVIDSPNMSFFVLLPEQL